MYRILKVSLRSFPTMYVLFTCICFVSMKESEEHVSSVSNNFVFTNSAAFRDDVSIEYSHEHIAVQKWRKNDAVLRKSCVTMYNKILPYVVNGSEDLDLSPGCKRALMKTLIGLKQCKSWAFKMIDSSGKLPSGFLTLDSYSLGNYDECLDVVVPEFFQGQYCNVDVKLPLPERHRFTSAFIEGLPEFENFSRSVSADSVTADLLRKIRLMYLDSFHTAVCVPSTCSKDEIQKLATKVVQGFEIYADVVIDSCEILQEKNEFGCSEIAIMIVLGILLILAITATAVDVYLKLTKEDENYQDNLNLPTKYLLCFSFYTNTRRLIKPDTSVDTIKVFHGMRVITILWVILSHTYLFQTFRVTSFGLNLPYYNKDISYQVLTQSLVDVDTFFFISAVVHSYGIMKLKDVKINYSLHILKRIIRLTIPFMFVIACVFLIPYLGSGAAWKETIEGHITGKCRSNWWTNLLFINNFIPQEEMCLGWFWYIAADTHLFLLSLLVIIPMRSNPRLAFAINLLILLGGICISEAFRFYYGLTQVPGHAHFQTGDMFYLLSKEHFPTYEHFSCCCVGLAVGYFLATTSFKMSIPWKVNVTLWLSALVLGLTVVYGVYEWNQNHIPNMIICMLYKSTRRFLWCLSLAWVTIACTTGNGGIVYNILAWSGFTTLARLTYMVYLIHPIIHYIYIGSTRTPIEMSHRSLVYIYIGDVVLSYMCAYVCSLLFELPVLALQNIIFSSHIPEDVKRLKTSNVLKKEVAELAKIHLSDHVNAKDDKNAGKKEEIKQNVYGSIGHRYQALSD